MTVIYSHLAASVSERLLNNLESAFSLSPETNAPRLTCSVTGAPLTTHLPQLQCKTHFSLWFASDVTGTVTSLVVFLTIEVFISEVRDVNN